MRNATVAQAVTPIPTSISPRTPRQIAVGNQPIDNKKTKRPIQPFCANTVAMSPNTNDTTNLAIV